MLEDRLLIYKARRGHEDAAYRIYEKYKDYLLTLATALLHNVSTAEDTVHSVFVTFFDGIGNFELSGSLKSYLAICVANRARNVIKAKPYQSVALSQASAIASDSPGPDQLAMHREDLNRLTENMKLLPYEQREVIVLRLRAGMKFKTIADLQNVSLGTILSRYRYGLEKLRSLFNEETTR